MARTWASGSVTTALGGLGFVSGPITIAVIHKRANDTDSQAAILRAGASSLNVNRWGLISNAGQVGLRSGNGIVYAPTMTATVADDWVLLAATKASGSVPPRFHKYVFSTGVWTHENSGSNQGDSGTPASGMVFGNALGSSDTAGAWDRVLADAEIEHLAGSLTAWLASAPRALWKFDQSVTTQKVIDLTGNGANESANSGGTIADGAPGFTYGAPVVEVTSVDIVGASVVGGNATAAGGTVTITASSTVPVTGAAATAAGGTVIVGTPSAVTITVVGGNATADGGTVTAAAVVSVTVTVVGGGAGASGGYVGLPVRFSRSGIEWHVTGLWKPGETTVPYYGRISDPQAGEVVIPLNDSRTASVTLSAYDDVVETLATLTQVPYAVCLKAYYGDRLVFWGPVKLRTVDLAAGTVKLDAVDMSLRLIHHMLRRGDLLLGDGQLAAENDDRGYVPIDHLGLRLLRDTADTETFPTLGILDGVNTFVTDPNALMGVTRGDQVWNAMTQLSQTLGPDFELEPVDDTEQAYCRLNTYTRQGVDVSDHVQFHYGTGLQNLDGLTCTEGEQYTNLVHVLDRDGKYRTTVTNATALTRTGPYIAWDATDYDTLHVAEEEARDVLEAYGTDIIDAYSVPLVALTMTLPVDTDDGLHYLADYGVGDIVGVAGRVGFAELPDGTYRITRVTLSQDGDDNAVRPSVDVVASRGGADTINNTED